MLGCSHSASGRRNGQVAQPAPADQADQEVKHQAIEERLSLSALVADHASGQPHNGDGPYVFIAEVPEDSALCMRRVLKVADRAARSMSELAEVDHSAAGTFLA
jgi:hypothetical protein